VNLLDCDRLTALLVSLQRSTSGGGRDKIDHPRGMHDDLANAVAGVLVRAFRKEDLAWQGSRRPLQTVANMGWRFNGTPPRNTPGQLPSTANMGPYSSAAARNRGF